MLVEKPLIGQTVIAPYMKDANNHILFTMKYIDMKFGRDVYGERMDARSTILPPFHPSQYWLKIAVVVQLCSLLEINELYCIVQDCKEKQKLRPIVQSETSGQMVSILFFLNNFVINVDIEPWSHIPYRRHPMS